jgi:hypothetical protein
MIGKRMDEARFGPATAGRYAVLTMDNLGLLIPQHQVHALEPGFDVQRSEEDGVDWISVGGAPSPVYCLSADLRPIREVPAGRHICVLLDTGTRLFGVLCDQVVMLDQAGLDLLPLQGCMRTPGTPLQGLVLHGERVMCVTSADNLLACLDQQDIERSQQPTEALGPAERLQEEA